MIIATDRYYIPIIQQYYSEPIRRWLAEQVVNLFVEIHPSGKAGCINRCQHCTGALPIGMKSPETIPIKPLIVFIYSLPEHDVRKLVISGCRTEPFTYKYIDEVIKAAKASNLSVGIHTTGELLTPDLMRLIAYQATPDSYISFSIDAYDSPCYNEGHQPLNKKGDAFSKIIKNAFEIGQLKSEFGSTLKINWHYLFLKCNVHSKEGIQHFIELAKDSGANHVRFSTPLFPVNNKGQHRRFEIVSKEEVEQATSYVEHARQEIEETPDFRVSVIPYVSPFEFLEKPSFRFCYHGELIRVIGSDGFIYPCTAVASVAFAYLRRGQVEDFWKVWQEKHILRVPEDCPGTYCDRFEGAFNRYVEQLVQNERPEEL
ncbi:hypothetical protein FJZ31_22110 [Candidatus Poribacteria bacterium]|nr:hypothetical protein [Candidatus Poribacteria bacterium]